MGDPELLRDVLAKDPLLLTPEEAATVLGIGRTTIYALMKAGELHPVHIGRSCRLPRAELERFVDHLQAPHRPDPPEHAGATGRPPQTRATSSTLSTARGKRADLKMHGGPGRPAARHSSPDEREGRQ